MGQTLTRLIILWLFAAKIGMQTLAENVFAFADDVGARADDQWVWSLHDLPGFIGIGQSRQKMPHRVQPRTLLVIGLDDGPGCIGGIGIEKHGLLGFGIVIPFIQRLDIDG